MKNLAFLLLLIALVAVLWYWQKTQAKAQVGVIQPMTFADASRKATATGRLVSWSAEGGWAVITEQQAEALGYNEM